MPAARYWRAAGLSAYGGGDVELRALQLYESSGDPDYGKVELLLHADGGNGSTTFVDSSPAPKALTRNGSAQISTAQSKFGGSSLVLSGLDSDVSIASPLAATDAFCMEAWVRLNATDTGGQYSHPIFGQGSSSGDTDQYFGILFENPPSPLRLRFYRGSGVSTRLDLIGTTMVPREQWVHCALTFDGAKIRGFLGGILQFEFASATAWIPTERPLRVGRSIVTGFESYRQVFQGHLDDVRITKGVARYTANFTPPTEPFPDYGAGTSVVRVDQGAVLTSAIPPISGDIASLQDDNPATTVRLAAREPGFALRWDFGAGVTKTIAAAAPGAASDSALFLSHFDLQSSNDGQSWVQEAVLGRYPWPGANTLAAPLFGNLPLFARTPVAPTKVAASSPVPAHSTPLAPRLQLARDVEHGGPGTIYGTTKTKGSPANTPTKARVVLLHQRSKQPVRETWSDPVTGAFAFTGIDTTQQFLTLAEDAAGNFRPVAANRLTPEVLP